MIKTPSPFWMLLWLTLAFSCPAQELKPILLPPPNLKGGAPLMDALQKRRSVREFLPTPLSNQLLSDLLWAANGINRPAIDHRTAPSAMNSQEIDIYLALPQGVFVYSAKQHQLNPVLAGDLRSRTGSQEFVKIAPVALLFVADLDRLTKAKPQDKERYAAIDTGFISQNIYLFCASARLGTVVHELDRTTLHSLLHLRPQQQVVLAQAVGFEKPTTGTPGRKP